MFLKIFLEKYENNKYNEPFGNIVKVFTVSLAKIENVTKNRFTKESRELHYSSDYPEHRDVADRLWSLGIRV